jgi:uncharacterized membrane protein
MEDVIVEYLKSLNIPISGRYVKKLVLSHPEYPSLLSVSDVLERLGISSQIASVNKNQLNKLNPPYLLFQDSQDELILIKSNKQFEKIISQHDAERIIFIKIEPIQLKGTISNERHYNIERRNKWSLSLLFSSLFILLLINLSSSFSVTNLTLTFTSIAGVIVSAILEAKRIGYSLQEIESFCKTEQGDSCEKVINSKGSKLFGMSLSQLAFSFFATQLLVILLNLSQYGNLNSCLNLLVVGSFLTIPIMVYSLYYQRVKMKVWCKLCLVINGVLLIQILFFSTHLDSQLLFASSIQLSEIFTTSLFFIGIASLVTFVVNKYQITKEILSKELESSRIKNTSDVFLHLLSKSEKIIPSNIEKEINIGYPDALIHLIMAISLSCKPCRMSFSTIVELFTLYPKKLKITLRVKASQFRPTGQILPSSYLIHYWETQISQSSNEYQKTLNLFNDWFQTGNLKSFTSKYPLDIENYKMSDDELNHYKWFDKQKITRTPTYFLNGHEIPKEYNIEDLALLINDLEEQSKLSRRHSEQNTFIKLKQ